MVVPASNMDDQPVGEGAPPCASLVPVASSSTPSLDIASYPHIFDLILSFALTDARTIRALRALSHAARDAVEARLAWHIVVKSTMSRDRVRYLGIWSHTPSGQIEIPGIRGRNYPRLEAGLENSALLPAPPTKRLAARVLGRTLKTVPPPLPPPPDVTPGQALATIERVLAYTRVLDVGEYLAGEDLLSLAPWLKLETVRLPGYRLAGANSDNPTLSASTVVLSPSAAGALRSSLALVIPPGTERVVSHEFIDIAPGTCANIYCGHGPSSSTATPTPTNAAPRVRGVEACACQTVREVILAFVQRKPVRGTSEMEFGHAPERVHRLSQTFPNAKIVLVGAEGARLGRDAPIQRPFVESNEVIKGLILESEFELDGERIECVKLAEWRRRVGEKRWEIEMGLGDVQVLNRSKVK